MRILLIDDDEEEFLLMEALISTTPTGEMLLGYDLEWVSTFEAGLAAIRACNYDVYLLDFRLGPRTGLDLLREAQPLECEAPVIMLTGQEDYAVDMAAMHLGAADYLVKGQLSLGLLERAIRYAVERRDAQRNLQKLVQERTHDLALLETQAQEMKALQKATASLLESLDLPVLMGHILDAAQQAIPAAEQAWLCLLDRPADGSQKLLQHEFSDARIYSLRLEDEPQGVIPMLGEGSTLLVDDAQAEPALLALLRDEHDRESVGSAVIAPLVLGQEVVGALSLTSPWPAAFSEATRGLLKSFATTATAALHNALLYSQIRELATTDPLTGRFNRRTFFEIGQREIDRARRFVRPLSAIMMDVDRFKRVNDHYGHSAGDQVLRGIVERCSSLIRHVDILGRYGGDEFAILLPEADRELAAEIANRIRNSVAAAPIQTDVGDIQVTVSMGVAQTLPNTGNVGLLLDQADQALYRSKQAGRNTVSTSE